MEQDTSWNVHHYTDLNALISILGKEKITLRATNISYLNDSRELKEGIEVVKKIENRDIHPGALRNYYITSFSKCDDNLSMWGMYAANGSGCSISFDYNSLQYGYEVIAKCTYGEEEIKNHLKKFTGLIKEGHFTAFFTPTPSQEAIEKSRNNLYDNIILTTCLTAKNQAYAYEQEIRGINYCSESQFIKFRQRNNYIVPYIEVFLPKTALKAITIGPTSNTELTMQSVVHFLHISGYDLNNITIKASKIPYRG